MSHTLLFSNIDEENRAFVGEKAYNLSLAKKYVEVPNGFVITSEAMKYFLEHNNLVETIKTYLDSLMSENENIMAVVNAVQKSVIQAKIPDDLGDEIRELYEGLAYDKEDSPENLLKPKEGEEVLVCARHGDWSEQNDNVYLLNVRGESKLFDAVKVLFASNFISTKIINSKKEGLDVFKNAAQPVIIQKMINVHRSGVSSSFNIKNNKMHQVTIAAHFGLGIAKDDEKLGFDEYVLNEDFDILDSKVGEQAYAYEKDLDSDATVKYDLKDNSKKEKISASHANMIGRTTKKLARILESAVVLEWGFYKNFLYIFDVKPVIVEEDSDQQRIDEYEEEVESSTQEEGVLREEESETFERRDEEEVGVVDESITVSDYQDSDLDEDLEILRDLEKENLVYDDETSKKPAAAEKGSFFDVDSFVGTEDENETETTQEENVKNDEGFAYDFLEGDLPDDRITVVDEEESSEELGQDEDKGDDDDEGDADLLVDGDDNFFESASEKIIEKDAQEEEGVKGDDDVFLSGLEVEDDGDFIFSKEEESGGENVEESSFLDESVSPVDTDLLKKSEEEENDFISLGEEESISEFDNRIFSALRSKYSELFERSPPSDFAYLLEELKTRIRVPFEEDIKRVYEIKQSYDSDSDSVNLSDLEFSRDTTSRFLEEF
ncbi:hypothetical protein GOV05_05020 [Candidatus Woesearchaeota archaeon]|nr:hypothetical protein [Candidatus Woesearchaeota archaeon]